MAFKSRYEEFVFYTEDLIQSCSPEEYALYKDLPEFGQKLVVATLIRIFMDAGVEKLIRDGNINGLREYLIAEGMVPTYAKSLLDDLVKKGLAKNPQARTKALHICRVVSQFS